MDDGGRKALYLYSSTNKKDIIKRKFQFTKIYTNSLLKGLADDTLRFSSGYNY